MKFSFFHLMPWTELTEAPAQWPVANSGFDPERGKQLYDSYIDTMAFAEECGFDWVGCNEHHFSPYGLMANCNLIGAVLAQRTRTIKLAMLGNLIPLLNPIRVAEEYAMLDVMSGGRLIAGMIRGVPHEYIAYNVVPDESRARLREAAALIVKAWTEPEPFGWEGEFYQYPSVSIWPRPLQRPHPPILMSASNEESAEFAGQHKAMMGMTLIADLAAAKRCIGVYRETARAHGLDTAATAAAAVPGAGWAGARMAALGAAGLCRFQAVRRLSGPFRHHGDAGNPAAAGRSGRLRLVHRPAL